MTGPLTTIPDMHAPSSRLEALRWLVQRPANRGDAAVLKAEALGTRAPAWLDAQFEAVRDWFPVVDLEQLRLLPEGTFGREYARHMDLNRLNPFVLSPTLDPSILRRHTYIVRQTVTHDMAHLLLNFDTSDAGEMGVYAFTVAQGSYASMHIGLWFAAIAYPLRFPLQTPVILHALRRGWRLGRTSKNLMATKLEEWWELPLTEVRARLGLPEDGN